MLLLILTMLSILCYFIVAVTDSKIFHYPLIVFWIATGVVSFMEGAYPMAVFMTLMGLVWIFITKNKGVR